MIFEFVFGYKKLYFLQCGLLTQYLKVLEEVWKIFHVFVPR